MFHQITLYLWYFFQISNLNQFFIFYFFQRFDECFFNTIKFFYFLETKLLPFSTEEIRKLDEKAIKEYEIPSLILMENAGRNAALYIRELILKRSNKLLENPIESQLNLEVIERLQLVPTRYKELTDYRYAFTWV